MFKRGQDNNQKEKIKAENMVPLLQEIIADQDRELARLRRIAADYEEFGQVKKELEKTTQEYKALCTEMIGYRKQYQELNMELGKVINKYKSGLGVAMEPSR